MSDSIQTKKYTKDHEWLLIDNGVITVGITDFAQQQLGDIVFIDLPERGQEISLGEDVVIIESVKAAGEVHAPLAGSVIEINAELEEDPELVNREPTVGGWLYKFKAEGDLDMSQLMGEDEYAVYLGEQED